MVDSLKVALTDFQVKGINRLTVQPSPVRFDPESGESLPLSHRLLWNNSRGPVEGVKAYYNAERFNLTVGPDFGGLRTSGPTGSACWVQMSLPKYCRGTNVKPVSRSEASEAFRDLERELDGAGIRADVSRARVIRLDTFRNVAAREPFGNYQPLFDMLQAKRTHKRDYGTTYLWHNSQRQFCVYDKREEVRLSGGSVKGLPANLLRFEHRLLNGRRVASELGLSTVGELERSWSRLPGFYAEAMRENLFRLEVPEVETLAASQFESDLLAFKRTGSRYWVEDCLTAIGAAQALRSIGPEALKVILERHLDRVAVWRKLRKVEGLRFRLEAARRSATGRTMAELYGELRSKVLAA